MLFGRADGVEQQLAVFAARVALADPRVAGEHVVAVAGALPGEDAVVEAEQADDAVGDRAHGYEGADGQRAGAEACSGGTAGEDAVEQGVYVGEAEGRLAVGCRLCDVGELAVQLDLLPGLVFFRCGQGENGVFEAGHPLVGGVLGLHQVLRGGQPVDQLREPAGQVDVGAVDVVERHDVVEDLQAALHGYAEQQPVEPVVPGALPDIAELPGLAMVRVEAPSHTGARHPAAQPFDLVVVEPEPLPHRGRTGEVEHLRRGDARGAELEQLREYGEQRVGLLERAVGEADPEPGRRVRGVLLGAEGERRRDDRRERLDVGAHHEYVAWFERGVVGEQSDDDLSQDLDLSRLAVAGVHLDGAVVVVEGWRVVLDSVVGEVLLEVAEQCVGVRCGGGVVDVCRSLGPSGR